MTRTRRPSHRSEQALAFIGMALLLAFACGMAARGATLVPSSAEVAPGEPFTLRLELEAGEPILGLSWYLKANGTFPVAARETPNEPLTEALGSISETRSADFGWIVENIEQPVERPLTAGILTLLAPAAPGHYSIRLDEQSVLLLADLSSVPVTANYALVTVVPEPPVLVLLALGGLIRFRKP
jgi:hypothetical protein